MTFQEQYRHPQWQKKRLEVFEYHNYQCENCGSEDKTLNVHHPYYKKNAKVWEYEVHELKCLCEGCHKDEHSLDDKIKELLAEPNISNDNVIGFCLHPRDFPINNEQVRGFLSKMSIPAHEKIVHFVLLNEMDEIDLLQKFFKEKGSYLKFISDLEKYAYKKLKKFMAVSNGDV